MHESNLHVVNLLQNQQEKDSEILDSNSKPFGLKYKTNIKVKEEYFTFILFIHLPVYFDCIYF